jgi:hypothetical protein
MMRLVGVFHFNSPPDGTVRCAMLANVSLHQTGDLRMAAAPPPHFIVSPAGELWR